MKVFLNSLRQKGINDREEGITEWIEIHKVKVEIFDGGETAKPGR